LAAIACFYGATQRSAQDHLLGKVKTQKPKVDAENQDPKLAQRPKLPKGFHWQTKDNKLSDYWFADTDVKDERLIEVLNEHEEVKFVSIHATKNVTANGVRYLTKLFAYPRSGSLRN